MRHAIVLCLVTLLLLGMAGCGPSGTDEQDPATEQSAEESSVGDLQGTYAGEFGATIELDDEGTLDAMVPLTIEIASDGSVTGSWDHSTTVPDPEIDSAQTEATFTGMLDGEELEASGKATLVLSGPAGTLTDTTGVIVTGTLSGDNIIGEISGYGEIESFIVTKQ